MAGISATCSTGSLLRKTWSSHTGVAKFPYNGLGAVERNQLNAGVSKPDGFSSALGIKKTREIKAMATPTVSAPKRENDPKKRVVITGMGLVSVFGSDIDAFYDKLLQGKSGITPIDRFDASNFPVRFAGQIHDFSSNGYIDDKIDRCLDDAWRYCIVAGRKALDDANLGPEVLKTVSERAIEALQFNDYGELRTRHEKRSKHNLRVFGRFCDAYHMTDPQPDGLGVSSCIRMALEDVGVSPEEVNYVNAHSTSTPVGDIAELKAIKTVFKDTIEMKMNGTKSMICHGLGASAALEAIASIKAINSRLLHPTINQYNLESEVTIDTVPNIKKKHEVNVAISNSFGFGGHNSETYNKLKLLTFSAGAEINIE